jgi:capsular polysaccharide biosynthesis protein
VTIGWAVRTIKKRRVLFIGVLVFVVGCFEVYSAKLTPRYHATAIVEMTRSPLGDLKFFENPVAKEADASFRENVENLNGEFLNRAAEAIDTNRRSTFESASLAARIAGAMSIQVENRTSFIRISATSSDPDEASRFANAYAAVMIENAPRKRREIIDTWRTYLTERLAQAVHTKAELEKSMEYLKHYEAIEPPGFTLVEKARTPAVMIYPNRRQHRSVAISVGLLLALAVVLVVETESLQPKSP